MGEGIVAVLNQADTITYFNLEILILLQSVFIGEMSSGGHILVLRGHDEFTGGTEHLVEVR